MRQENATVRKCPFCGQESKEQSRCPVCGARLPHSEASPKTCPLCGCGFDGPGRLCPLCAQRAA